MRTTAHSVMVGMLLVIAAGLVSACGGPSAPVPADALTAFEPGLFTNLRFRSIGPAVMGGRIDDVVALEHDPSTIYVGTASGGVWKTTNAGVTWDPIFDNQPVASIGDLAVAPSDPNLVWVGTGEANNRQSSSFGVGVYKSVNGGRSWEPMGLRETQAIGRIVVDPKDPNVVYVAAVGHLWGANEERGLFKTIDGGKTWTPSLFIDENTGVTDVAMHPSNSRILYAAAYQRRRTAWGFSGGGPGSGIFRTTDGGLSWKRLAAGLPQGDLGRIGLDVCRAKPDIVYAIVEHRNGGVFRSDDAGGTWRKVNDLNPRPMYYSQVRVDPTSDQRVYVLGAPFFVSNDGGRTFADPTTGQPGNNRSMTPVFDVGVHSDHHALWINPANPRHLILGGDGGLYVSYDGSVSWDHVDNLPIAQFYGIGVDMQKPYHIYGGMQDTHSWGGPSATRYYSGISNAEWFQLSFDDGMFAQPDPIDPKTVYVGWNDGTTVRSNLDTGYRENIKPHPRAGEPVFRFNWTSPFLVSPHDPNRIYLGGNRLFTSTDRGRRWTASVDLTRAEDRNAFPIMGVLPSAETLSRHDGVSGWGTITALGESPVAPGLLWVGTDDGNLQVTRDGGKTWTNVADRVPGLPPRSWVSRVEPSRAGACVAYAAFDRHRDDDVRPYVFKTADCGETWASIAGNLPPVGWVNVVREHPKRAGLLTAGTETGLFISAAGDGRWIQLRNGLPTVPVDDIVVHPRENDLIVATHGRSIYILDDTTPIDSLTSAVVDADVHLFQPRPAAILMYWKRDSYAGQRRFLGSNPPAGMILDYYLKGSSRDAPTIEILDGEGQVVRALAGGGERGVNRLVWDLRLAPPEGVPGGKGPFVVPGQYTARLTAGGRGASRTVQVDPDPDYPMSADQYRARQEFLLTLNALRTSIYQGIGELDRLESEVKALGGAAKGAETLARRLGAVRESFGRRGAGVSAGSGAGVFGGAFVGGALRTRVEALVGEIDGDLEVRMGTLAPPTVTQRQRLEDLSAEARKMLAELAEIRSLSRR